jgi:hypothetical protein
MKIIKQVLGWKFTFGGEEASGWLPLGAVNPLPTPIKHCILDVYISEEGGGYMLNWAARNSDEWSCSWHQTIEDAGAQAVRDLGIKSTDWVEPSRSEDSIE